jgi:hypothetical protein
MPKAAVGSHYDGLAHVADWRATYASGVAGITAATIASLEQAPFQDESKDHWAGEWSLRTRAAAAAAASATAAAAAAVTVTVVRVLEMIDLSMRLSVYLSVLLCGMPVMMQP